MSPRFFNQKMEQKLPEKKIPSTAAKAISRSLNDPFVIHFNAQLAFLDTQGTVSMA
jgi:hypothetical protein